MMILAFGSWLDRRLQNEARSRLGLPATDQGNQLWLKLDYAPAAVAFDVQVLAVIDRDCPLIKVEGGILNLVDLVSPQSESQRQHDCLEHLKVSIGQLVHGL